MPITVIGNTVIGTVSDDQITLSAVNYGIDAVNIEGNGGNDELIGDARNNLIHGGDGNDRIYGQNGMDSLYGDAGDDRFFLKGEWSSASYDQPGGLTHFYTASGPIGTDFFDGGTGFDQLIANENNLTLVLNNISEVVGDSIEGIAAEGAGNFRAFFQGSGLQDFTRIKLEDVRLEFSFANNTIIGSSANQQYDSNNDGVINGLDAYNGATGNDVIDGSYGLDTVIFNGNISDYSINYLGNGEFRVSDLNMADGDTGQDILVDIERFQFNDQTIALDIAVSDTDAAGGTALGGNAGTVAEGVSNGSAVGIDLAATASADLLALVPGATAITYALADDAGGRFAIDPVTGIVTVANTGLLDYQTAPDINGGPDRGYTITVEASAGGVKSPASFTILVTPGNDAPDVPSDANAGADVVMEGAATGTLVGITAQASDPNGNPVTYSLANNDGGRFQINATTGVVSVLNGALLDYETEPVRYITVRATDSLGASSDSVFAISLEDFIGDQPVDSDAGSDLVDENAATGTYTGLTASAMSPTASPVTYSLADDAGGRFQINATTGAVTVLNGALLDAETQNAWNVTVRASDGASIGDQVFTIYINDVAVETWSGTNGNDSYTLASLGEWTLNGLGGNDTLTAIDGANVTFVGGGGNDTLEGRNGNDIFQFAGTTGGLDAVSGGDGYDIVQATADNTTIGLSALSGVEEIQGGGFTNVSLQLGTGDDVIDSNVIALSGIAGIRAGAGHDTIIGTYGDETILGEDGNDIIRGGQGADILNGGTGIDTVSYAGSWDALVINLATNTVSGGDATGDTITGFENVVGSDYNDSITGSSVANVIEGGAGDDVMDGGGGNDTFRIGLNSGIDALIGGSGTDTVLFTEDHAVLALSSLATVELFNATGITNATITGNDLNNTLNFGSATLTNIAGIFGLAGNDTITGSAGADIITGGDGNDTLNAGNGDDTLRYDDADEGFDAVNGGAGTDTIEATTSGVTIGLSSITGIEAINGYGDTIILGSTAANTLNFSTVTLNGISAIDGGGGNDTITGSTGYDYIKGDAGADRLSGYLGYDMLEGGAGNDIFDFNTVADSDATNGQDVILDFVKGQDKVDVTTIDANTALAGDQNFSFLGNAAFAGVAGQLRYQNDFGDGYTHVFADVDGDTVADLHIMLLGTYTLAAGDFVL